MESRGRRKATSPGQTYADTVAYDCADHWSHSCAVPRALRILAVRNYTLLLIYISLF